MTRSLFVVLLMVCGGCDGVASSNPVADFDSLQAAVDGVVRPDAPLNTPALRVFAANPNGLEAKYAQPGLASHNGEFTPDGRLMAKNQCPIEGRRDGEFCLQVFRPEALAAAGSLQKVTEAQLAAAYSQDLAVDPSALVKGTTFAFEKGHLCMPATQPVRASGSSDEYDLTFVMLVSEERAGTKHFFLAGRGATVTVASAKTNTAAPTQVSIKGELEVAEIPFKNLPELNFTRDGKLAAGRYEGLAQRYSWTMSNGSAREETDDSLMFYLYSQDPCDVRSWVRNGFKPLPAAHADANVNGRYGFAKNPIRVMTTSSTLQTLGETDKLWGSYAWIDPTGANVIYFKSVKAAFLGAPSWTTEASLNGERLDLRALTPDQQRASLDDTVPVTMVVGSWTWGREVALDGRLSLADIPVSVTESQTTSRVNVLKLPKFYGGTGEQASVELDETTRGSVASNYWGANKHLWVKSGIRFSSISNIFNYYPHLRPTTKRDVVWYVTRGHVTDEVVFDDLLDPSVLVYSEMNAAVPNDPNRALCDGSGCGHLWVQNAATGAVYDVPAVGEVVNGVRLEPVAAGGRFGRGLWLERATTLTYEVPAARTGFARADWYAGISFDVRPGGEQTQRLMTVRANADGGTLFVEGRMNTDLQPAQYELRLNGTAKCATLARPQWHTFGLVANGESATVFVDGAPTTCSVPSTVSIFDAKVTFGGGFRGWVDQARVMVDLGRPSEAGRVGNWAAIRSELFCNYAGGTLGLNANGPVCVRDGVVPSPQRETILLADSGQLFHNAPRKNTVGNSFCATCHVATNWVRGGLLAPQSLSRQALTVADGINAPMDPRRQPMQPPANQTNANQPLSCVWGVWTEANTRLVAPGLTTPTRVGDCLPLDSMLLPTK